MQAGSLHCPLNMNAYEEYGVHQTFGQAIQIEPGCRCRSHIAGEKVQNVLKGGCHFAVLEPCGFSYWRKSVGKYIKQMIEANHSG